MRLLLQFRIDIRYRNTRDPSPNATPRVGGHRLAGNVLLHLFDVISTNVTLEYWVRNQFLNSGAFRGTQLRKGRPIPPARFDGMADYLVERPLIREFLRGGCEFIITPKIEAGVKFVSVPLELLFK